LLRGTVARADAKTARAACALRCKQKKSNNGGQACKIRYEMRKINAAQRPRYKVSDGEWASLSWSVACHGWCQLHAGRTLEKAFAKPTCYSYWSVSLMCDLMLSSQYGLRILIWTCLSGLTA